ncbi:MAG TPA: tRNA (adenosine(37)-N6)-threonylcarbamoyltransferase complex dimerization subunit type 1 TsaB [Candidatus Peribacterales bacterium]|nr:tRNA (adenosine(37)-N6)-threonylcarbamoyltransferase complex dimerization subunit type 1 TsaB [Candidatus Peribacterales bacterium]
MLTLFLDTASNSHSLALCTESELLLRVPLKTHGDTDLVPAIENILKEKDFTYKDLMHLASVIGPGGFTSLRVGVTAINMLSYALDLPSTGIHLSDLWSQRVLFERGARAERVRRVEKHFDGAQDRLLDSSSATADSSLEENRNFLWLHSTRRTQIFVKGYGTDGTVTPVGTFGLEDAVQLQDPYVGELIPEHQTLLSRCTMIPEKELTPLNEFLPGFLAKLAYQKQQLEPWYGRQAD